MHKTKTKKMNIKKFYIKKYSDDINGIFINSNATFLGLLDELHLGRCVYEYLTTPPFGDQIDTLIRERLFSKLAIILNKDYEYIYQLWMNESETKQKQKK